MFDRPDSAALRRLAKTAIAVCLCVFAFSMNANWSWGQFDVPDSLKDVPRSLEQGAQDQLGRLGQTGRDSMIQGGQAAEDFIRSKTNEYASQIFGSNLDSNTSASAANPRSRDLITPPATRFNQTNSPAANADSSRNDLRQSQASSINRQGVGTIGDVNGPSTMGIDRLSNNNQIPSFANTRATSTTTANASTTPPDQTGRRNGDLFGAVPNSLQRSAASTVARTSQGMPVNQVNASQQEQNLTAEQLLQRYNNRLKIAEQQQIDLQSFSNGNFVGSYYPNPNLKREEVVAGGWDYDRFNRVLDPKGNAISSALYKTAPAARMASTPVQTRPYSSTDMSRARAMPGGSRDQYDSIRPFENGSNSRISDYAQDPSSRPESFASSDTLRRQEPTRYNDNLANDPTYQRRSYSERERGFVEPNYSQVNQRMASPAYRSASMENAAMMTQRAPTSTQPISATDPGYANSQRQASANPPPAAANATNSTASTTGQKQPPTIITKTKEERSKGFFNLLLAGSFIVNLYLAWWLRHLLSKYRHMVMAKRVAQNAAAA
ncbi:MAG: hypothetical protein AAF664_05590 [Planctomycetota bacterium]